MLVPGFNPAAQAPACAVVGMGRCVGPVRRAASDAGLATMWFPEMDALLRRPPESLSLLIFAPSMGSEVIPPAAGPVAQVPRMAVITDGGLAPVDAQGSTGSLETFRFPLEREAFVAAAVEAVGDGRGLVRP